MVEGLLDVGRAVGLASDIDGVGGSARERLLESDEELAGRRRGHRARHVDMCVCGRWGLDVVEVCLKSQWTDSDEKREKRASNLCREEYKNRELKVEHVPFCR